MAPDENAAAAVGEKEKTGVEKEKTGEKEKTTGEKTTGEKSKTIGDQNNKGPSQIVKRKKEGEIARDQPSLIQKGEVLQNLFEVEEACGGGGFGQIYKVNHREFRQKMALKIEPAKGDVRRAKLEMTVMLMLRGKAHIPILYGCGKIRECPYIVMQLLGKNLSDLRRRQPSRCLSESSVFRVSIHVITALNHLHEMGYVHRDIKPSNCCMGYGAANRRKAHLIDFGMVRRIRDMEGKLRPPRRYAPFRGTVRYVSIQMHQRKEVGFGDDLIGWFYAMIELLNGRLPWSTFEKTSDILSSKTGTPVKDLCDSHPKGLLKFANYVMNISYEQIPKYEQLQLLLKSCLAQNVNDATPYDWEVNTPPAVAKSKRIMERSIMVSVGTELPPPIDALPPPKKLRTPSGRRKKDAQTPSPKSPAAASQTPPTTSIKKLLSLPLDPQQTLDIDEHLISKPNQTTPKTKSMMVKIRDKSTTTNAMSKEKVKERKIEDGCSAAAAKKILVLSSPVPPSSLTLQEVDKTQSLREQ